jgi:hypothetical protein
MRFDDAIASCFLNYILLFLFEGGGGGGGVSDSVFQNIKEVLVRVLISYNFKLLR